MSDVLPSSRAALILYGIRNSCKLFILPLLLALCTLFYYFGELVDWAAWEAIRIQFFYGIHDIHRLLFLIPIIYAAHTARVKGALIVTLVTFVIFLPRAFIISPYPDPLLRMVLFTVFAGGIGVLTAVSRNKTEQYRQLEVVMRSERATLLSIIEKMTDGVLIIGPDYRIRFMNANMVKDFGEGVDSLCYEHLHSLNSPCSEICKLPNVINGEVEGWKYNFPDGRSYEIIAAPYIDTDGVVCQLSTFKNITKGKKLS